MGSMISMVAMQSVNSMDTMELEDSIHESMEFTSHILEPQFWYLEKHGERGGRVI